MGTSTLVRAGEAGDSEQNAKMSSPAPDHTSRAAQGLLELSNTGKVWIPVQPEQEKREAVNMKMSTPAPDHTSRAAQGLLELSNTGKVWVPVH